MEDGFWQLSVRWWWRGGQRGTHGEAAKHEASCCGRHDETERDKDVLSVSAASHF